MVYYISKITITLKMIINVEESKLFNTLEKIEIYRVKI